MKRQIFPVLILSLVLPWIVPGISMEDHRDTIRQNKRNGIRQNPFPGVITKLPINLSATVNFQPNKLII